MARNDLPSPTAPNFPQRLREAVMTYLGRTGDPLDRGITLRDLIEGGFARLRDGYTASQAAASGGALPIAPESQAEEPDLTPPPTPTGFTVSAAISHVFIEHDAPLYTQGHGHLRTRVYGKIVAAGDPLPVFADAAEITQFTGTVHAHPSNPSTTWRLWIKWESADGVLSVSPAGGTNGVQVVTGQDVSLLLEALTGEITESQLYTDLGGRIDLIDDPATGLVKKVGDLETTYGSTASAAASAAAAASSASSAAIAEANALLAQTGAVAAKDQAVTAKTNAETAASSASTSATSASNSATGAAGSAATATTQATNAANSATAAGGSATSASNSASSASTSATNAGNSATAADSAKVAAESARDSAQSSATAAASSASTATTKAADASQSASAASTSATNAATSASNAATSATQAATSETNAAGSASSASTSATNAANSASAAGGSATAAAASASTASTEAGNAGTSATVANTAKVAAESARDAAAGSAGAAATSASTASTKATEASQSASAAATSATNAATSASSAQTYASNAATSESNAAASAATASTQAGVASTSATNAGNSASAAATSASSASTSATNAANSATAAAQDFTAVTARLDAAGGTGVTVEQALTANASSITGLSGKYTVKIDNAGHVSGYGLASTANDATPTSEFGVRADKFWIAGAATESATAPSTGLFKGRVWRDTSLNPALTKYWTGSAWSTSPQVLPFVVLTTAGTINDVSVPAGVYIDTAFIADATVTRAKIADLAVDDAKIADLSVSKLTGAEMQVGAFIQSTSFSSGPGGSGFRLDAAGNAELNNATVRGTVFATDGQFIGEVIAQAPSGNKARMWSGDFEIYKQVPSVGLVLYKALSRVESGVGANNVQVTIPGYFLNQPRVIVSPANIRLYENTYANQAQLLQCEAQSITESSPGSMVWRFTPVATLNLGANSGQTVLNQSSGQVSTGWTSSQYTTPANTTAITPSVNLASFRGTGTSGGYYRRTARWRVQYLNGGTWVDGTWTTVDLPSSVSASAASTAAFTFPSAAAWTFRIQFEAYDTGGTFTTTVEYEYATDTVTRSDAQTIQAQVAFGGANSASASLNYVPSYTLPSGWALTGITFSYVYSYSVSRSGSFATAEVAQTPYSGGLSIVAPPNSSGTNLTRSRSASSNVLNFSTTASRSFSSESATASLTLNSVTGVYSRRRALTNSTAAANSFSLASYTYQLTAAQVLATGSLNWIAIGE